MSEIINFYERMDTRLNPKRQSRGPFELPFRMVIAGPSGSGKTNALMNVVKYLNGIFIDLTLIVKNQDEPLYNYLREKIPDERLNIHQGLENIPNLDEFSKEQAHLIIFDDLVLAKDQRMIAEYFMRARKQNCSVIYLSQSYFLTPKFIRQNINYLILTKIGSAKDIVRVLSEHSLTVGKEELKRIYNYCVAIPLNFLLLDLSKDKLYRNFDIINRLKFN